MDGSIICPIFLNHTGHLQKSRTGPGSPPRSTGKLYEATRKRAHEPKMARYKWESEQLHDYVLFAANTGLRPDEAWRLQFRDVKIVEDDPSGQNEP